jgi:hypothetical protein
MSRDVSQVGVTLFSSFYLFPIFISEKNFSITMKRKSCKAGITILYVSLEMLQLTFIIFNTYKAILKKCINKMVLKILFI